MMRERVELLANPGLMALDAEGPVPPPAFALQDRGERENSIEPSYLLESGPGCSLGEILRPHVTPAGAADRCRLVHTSGV
jgi:hypothetical protein